MRLVLPDTLDAEQRSVFDSYSRAFTPGGVCVNVMLGTQPWDVRPLVLEQGRVWLYRFSCELAAGARNELLAELEGFAVLPNWELAVTAVSGLERFVTVRPFYQTTLADQIKQREIVAGGDQLPLVQGIISQLRLLARRNLSHGHISLSNIAVSDSGVVLLDPRIGLVNGVRDSYVAPESTPDHPPHAVSDLFGLGRVIGALLGDDISVEQEEIVSQLTLPSPRQRPDLQVVEEVFGCAAPSRSKAGSSGGISSGRVLSGARGANTRSTLNQASRQNVKDTAPAEVAVKPITWNTPKVAFYTIALALALGALLRFRYPSTYYALSEYVPLLAPQASDDYEAAWTSGERLKMRKVARAAVLDKEPAAKNTIINDVMGGASPPTTNVALMRFALDELWRDELSYRDVQAVVNLTVAQIVPEGVEDLPSFQSLHPAVILAIAGQMPPTNPSPQLKAVTLDKLTALPDPVGEVFEQLRALGSKTLADPEAMGLASIVIGKRSAAAIEAYIGSGEQVEQTLGRIAVALPLIATSEELSSQVVAALRDRGGPLGQALGWFDIEDLAEWSKVGSAEKLRLLLGKFPATELSLKQYADLLLFPLPEIRREAANYLKRKFFSADSENMLVFLSGDQNLLTREQNLALVTALQLKKESRVPFVAAWFQMQPSPDVVLLLLLSRANFDSTDLFNLEASRYLKKMDWKGSQDLARLLARHPEPLARSLAYARLDPTNSDDKRTLEERQGVESDEALKKLLSMRIERARLRQQQAVVDQAALPQPQVTPAPAPAPTPPIGK